MSKLRTVYIISAVIALLFIESMYFMSMWDDYPIFALIGVVVLAVWWVYLHYIMTAFIEPA